MLKKKNFWFCWQKKELLILLVQQDLLLIPSLYLSRYFFFFGIPPMQNDPLHYRVLLQIFIVTWWYWGCFIWHFFSKFKCKPNKCNCYWCTCEWWPEFQIALTYYGDRPLQPFVEETMRFSTRVWIRAEYFLNVWSEGGSGTSSILVYNWTTADGWQTKMEYLCATMKIPKASSCYSWFGSQSSSVSCTFQLGNRWNVHVVQSRFALFLKKRSAEGQLSRTKQSLLSYLGFSLATLFFRTW